MIHTHSDEGPPCRHMEQLLQEAASNNLTGIKKWYVLAHAARCSHCGTFLERMKATLAVLNSAKKTEVDPSVLQRLREKAAAAKEQM